MNTDNAIGKPPVEKKKLIIFGFCLTGLLAISAYTFLFNGEKAVEAPSYAKQFNTEEPVFTSETHFSEPIAQPSENTQGTTEPIEIVAKDEAVYRQEPEQLQPAQQKFEPKVTQLIVNLPSEATEILTLSNKAQLYSLRVKGLEAELKATSLQKQLSGKPSQSHSVVNEYIQDVPQQVKPNILNDLIVKSLVASNGTVTGWVSVKGELIPIKRGSTIGSLSVTKITEDYVEFKEGDTKTTRWMTGYQSSPTRGRQ